MELDGDDWQLAYAQHSRVKRDGTEHAGTTDAIRAAGYPTVAATVPGNFELDLQRAGLLEDPFYDTNIWTLQKLEGLHLFYSRTFKAARPGDGTESVLLFEGIDTVAEVWLNGQLLGCPCNMLIEHEFEVSRLLREGENELLVHITPAAIAAREEQTSPAAFAMRYNYGSLYLRKAPACYGWDIMPRVLSGGLWRSVSLLTRPTERIESVYTNTCSVNVNGGSAELRFWYQLKTDADLLEDYTVAVSGVCGDSTFAAEDHVWFTTGELRVNVANCKFWWPKNSGVPNLYDTVLSLKKGGTVVDQARLRVGVRTVRLDRSSTTDDNGSGRFCFFINDKPVFAMGTNWVPVDAFHSRDRARLQQILPMLNDLNCNMVRCWGGNVYEHEDFYDFCDENGIMIWQDFAMACAQYPRDERFRSLIEPEVTSVVRKYRNHPALVLWAGDNECDAGCNWSAMKTDPNANLITRRWIPDILSREDPARPYLPSSPYIDETAVRTGRPTPEDHLWGPRDYFKGAYYTGSPAHFASETGYHGCPSVKSLQKFISPDHLWPWRSENGKTPNDGWLSHAACMESGESPYSYRIKLMEDQIRALFGYVPDNLPDFSAMSQISQAEAKKFFIERFRTGKWRRTGILWWNLIDGWPQISDAIVDYTYTRKLAYHYIKRSQQPVLLAFDEPENDGTVLALYGINEFPRDCAVSYTVRNITDGVEVARASGILKGEASEPLLRIGIEPGEKKFYLIEWDYTDGSGASVHGKNHYFTNILDIDYSSYTAALDECGMMENEGF